MLRVPRLPLRVPRRPDVDEEWRCAVAKRLPERRREADHDEASHRPIARATGSTEKTLRYYDHIGLLRPADRSPAGYRLYNDEAIERLRFIRNAQDLGLCLSDIRSILDISDGGRPPCQHVLTLVERNLSKLEAHLKRLGELHRVLADVRGRLVEAVASGSVEAGRFCQCLA